MQSVLCFQSSLHLKCLVAVQKTGAHFCFFLVFCSRFCWMVSRKQKGWKWNCSRNYRKHLKVLEKFFWRRKHWLSRLWQFILRPRTWVLLGRANSFLGRGCKFSGDIFSIFSTYIFGMLQEALSMMKILEIASHYTRTRSSDFLPYMEICANFKFAADLMDKMDIPDVAGR